MADTNSFDFVILGGGTAGLVVAARLSEIESISVAVIEAGEDHGDDERVKIPGRWIFSIGSELDWGFMSLPQPGLNGRQVGQPAGKALGGSSAINGHAFIQPTRTVVDGWAEVGNPDWNWERLRPYFQKSSTVTLPPEDRLKHLSLSNLDISKGSHGPIQAYYSTPLDEPLAPAWSQTFENVGYGASGTSDAGLLRGGFSSPASIDPVKKERSYSRSAYYGPAARRPNLKVFTSCVVERVLLETTSAGERATGVQVAGKEGSFTIQARKEVILSAGAFGSPKILELSGIGDSKILAKHGIKQRIDLPSVGEGMQDHLMTGISFEVNDDVNTLDKLRSKDPEATAAAEKAYQERREGPLSFGGINYFSFMPIDVPGSGADPELERLLDALDAHGNKGLERQYQYLKSVVRSKDKASGGVYLSPRGTTYGASSKASDYSISSLPGKYITIGLSLVQPFSRGRTHIASADPSDAPVIDPGYLSNPVDVEVAALHLRFIERLAATKPLANFIKPGGLRNAEVARGDDREMARQWAKRSVLSNWHGCGTCSMMPKDLGGVVSQRLVVYGTTNLRVVDASVYLSLRLGIPSQGCIWWRNGRRISSRRITASSLSRSLIEIHCSMRKVLVAHVHIFLCLA